MLKFFYASTNYKIKNFNPFTIESERVKSKNQFNKYDKRYISRTINHG